MMYRYFKRVLDFLVAWFLWIVFSPLMLILVIIVQIKLGKPVFFKQIRPGKNNKMFNIYKFRTMTLGKDSSGCILPDKERMTSLGKFLRSTSLDELPELINVINGDMSLVGPRPLITDYLVRYNKRQIRRHEVRPGITGWAQINGRNALTWDEKFEFDVWYVDNYTLKLDFRILLKTIRNVYKREGISHIDNVTMPEFIGS